MENREFTKATIKGEVFMNHKMECLACGREDIPLVVFVSDKALCEDCTETAQNIFDDCNKLTIEEMGEMYDGNQIYSGWQRIHSPRTFF